VIGILCLGGGSAAPTPRHEADEFAVQIRLNDFPEENHQSPWNPAKPIETRREIRWFLSKGDLGRESRDNVQVP
jgi:hypothetical protein